MYEINKDAFGEFLAQQRKEKGYTQKELAEKLFVSDKAVSKWERGLSMPDISLLIPLAGILDVSVTEILEGRKLDRATEMDVERVEVLVKKALAFSEDTPETKKERTKKRLAIFGGCAVFALFEMLVGWKLGEGGGVMVSFLVFECMSFVFGIYFWFFMKDWLPAYYDENQIHVVSDGIFRMNMPGVHFNNSNWPHIARYLRGWSVVTLTAVPLIGLLLSVAIGNFYRLLCVQNIVLIAYLAALFVPIYVIGRKYGMEERPEEKKPVCRMVIGVVAALAAAVLISLVLAGAGFFRSAVRIGYVSSGSLQEWSATYRFLDGWMNKKLYPQEGTQNYRIEIKTESGRISVELTDSEGNVIFFEEDMPSGSFPVRLEGRTNVRITAEEHRGSFSIVPSATAFDP